MARWITLAALLAVAGCGNGTGNDSDTDGSGEPTGTCDGNPITLRIHTIDVATPGRLSRFSGRQIPARPLVKVACQVSGRATNIRPISTESQNSVLTAVTSASSPGGHARGAPEARRAHQPEQAEHGARQPRV